MNSPIALPFLSMTGLASGAMKLPNGFELTASGLLGLGITPAARLHVADTTASAPRGVAIDQHTADIVPAALFLRKSRHTTPGSHTVVQDNDILGGVLAYGSDGAAYIPAASVRFIVDGTPGSNDMPGRIELHTTADGASSSLVRMMIKGSGFVGIGGTPLSRLLVSDNATIPTPTAGAMVHIVQADASGNTLLIEGAGAGSTPAFIGRRSNGTMASRSATVSGTGLFALQGIGFDTAIGTSPKVRIDLLAAETWGSGANGTEITFGTTPIGSTTLATVVRFSHDGGIQAGAPTGGSKGLGSANFAADIYKNNTAYTNPDYVLEHWAEGRIVQFLDREGALEYTGLRPIHEVEAFARSRYVLPRIHEARVRAGASGMGLFGGGDAVLASLEEAYLYLFDHERRVAALEARWDAE